MKKYFMLFVVASGLTVASFAQSKEKNEREEKHEKKEHVIVPESVKNSFAKQFPGITPKWEMEDGNYEAEFKHMGHEMSAVFEPKGSMTESEMAIRVSQLPAPVLEFVKTNHKGATIKEAAKITKTNGEVNYEAEVKGKDLMFDASGKFLKEVKD